MQILRCGYVFEYPLTHGEPISLYHVFITICMFMSPFDFSYSMKLATTAFIIVATEWVTTASQVS
jgi:hypothetical protein